MQANTEHTLEDVKRRFTQWRKNKSHRDRIPEELWAAAVSLYDRYPITQILKELRLEHGDLKKRIRQRQEHSLEALQPVAFVEVPLSVISSRLQVIDSECDHFEIERRDGAKMRIFSRASQGFDTFSLIHTFLGETHDPADCTE